MSFGRVADDYDRVRPSPPDAALDWLVPPDCDTAVDVAAGTGLFTRALRSRVSHVTAVEPDDRMRAVLAARSPGVRVVAGRGEAIPLPDGSTDGVFVSSAWHWLDPARAVPEIARVLRDGGRLGVIWTSRDRAVDWVAELDALRRPHQARSAGDARSVLRRRHAITLPESAPFENAASASFGFTRTMTVDSVVAWVGTNSGVITAPAEEREAGLARVRDALLRRAGGDGTVEIPLWSRCWRADRIRRPLSGRPVGAPYPVSRGKSWRAAASWRKITAGAAGGALAPDQGG
ncbi:MAG TPA: class I SAM-dependent methyltransferase [Trebonia sp.]|nr:class I SAM-dependent methyltransferase [Trebonia sp.]